MYNLNSKSSLFLPLFFRCTRRLHKTLIPNPTFRSLLFACNGILVKDKNHESWILHRCDFFKRSPSGRSYNYTHIILPVPVDKIMRNMQGLVKVSIRLQIIFTLDISLTISPEDY